MSVQQQCPNQLPKRVRITPFGKPLIGTVLETQLEATAGTGPQDVLTVDVNGSHFRVPAADVQPVHDIRR